MALRGVRETTYYYPPYEFDCPSSPALHARLAVTEDVLVAWSFNEIAPEVLLEELHTACELTLEALVNRHAKKLSFAQLVATATQTGLLSDAGDVKLLTALKDLRKKVRHRNAEGAGAWLDEHGEQVAICIERLVRRVPQSADGC